MVAGNAKISDRPLRADSTKVSATNGDNEARKSAVKGRVSESMFDWKNVTRMQRKLSRGPSPV